jgi:hypothetical protein
MKVNKDVEVAVKGIRGKWWLRKLMITERGRLGVGVIG